MNQQKKVSMVRTHLKKSHQNQNQTSLHSVLTGRIRGRQSATKRRTVKKEIRKYCRTVANCPEQENGKKIHRNHIQSSAYYSHPIDITQDREFCTRRPKKKIFRITTNYSKSTIQKSTCS